VPVPSPLLLEITFGGFVHDQTLFQVYPDRETLTTRFLFRESIAFGIGLDRGWRLLAFADHLSNGHLGQANRGVNKAGLVLGYRFGEGGLNPPPIQAPTPARQFDWAGPFAGFSAGYARGMDDFVIHFVGTPDVAFSGRVGSLHLAAQVGANWMFGRFLAGLEGDFAAQRLEDSTTRFLPIQEEVSVHINWLATARARVGVVIDPPFAGDRLLLYGTGGLASSQFVKRYCDPVINICYLNGNEKEGWIAAEFIKTGWTIGGGAELPLTPHATVKAEYLYIDFSQFSYDYGPFTNDFASRLHVLRAGFNFGFFN
jgi:outer membrane immunogenic protein